jgi:hypothetical protein
MAIIIKTDDDLIIDQSAGLQDSDIEVIEDSSLLDLESRANDFYLLLDGAGLFAGDSFADLTGAAESVDDFVTVTNGGSTVENLFFSKNADGDALDGQVWTYNDPNDSNTLKNVLTTDGDLIYIYSINDGQVMIASTEVVVAPTEIGDFTASDIVMAAYISPSEDLKTAEIFTVTFQAIEHFDATDPDDTVDLTNNLWISANTSLEFKFNDLVATKFLFGIAGDGGDQGSDVTKLFLIGKGYNVDDEEEPVNGKTLLNTSQGGELPGDKDVATVGLDNQMINEGQGLFLMLVETQMAAGAYHDGDDLAYSSFRATSDLSYTITQAVSNTAVEMQITGYFDAALTNPDLAILNTDPITDETLGQDGDRVNLDTITVIDGLGNVIYSEDDEGAELINNNGTFGRSVDITMVDQFTAVITGLEAADTIAATWESPINHELVETVTGKVDIGKVSLLEGDLVSANVGADMFVDDDGPKAVISEDIGTVAHDETDGVQGSPNDNPMALPTIIATYVTAYGGGATLMGWALSADPVVNADSTDFGTDGDGGVAFEIDVGASNDSAAMVTM